MAAVLASVPLTASADPSGGEDPAQAESRFSFAQSYIGLNLSYAPSPGKFDLTPNDGEPGDSFDLPTMFAPRLVLGGLHFWGHADIYVAFSPVWYRTEEPQGFTTRFSLAVETGLKIYPFALLPGTLRPFAGVAWAVNTYSQDDGPLVTMHQLPAMLGAAWRTDVGVFEIGASLHFLGERDYPLSRTNGDRGAITPEVVDIWLGYRWVFDATASATEASRSGALAERYESFAKDDKITGWELALGPSAAFPFSKSQFSEPGGFLDGLRRPTFVPDAAFGYYWHSIDAVVRANYRFFYAVDEGYGRSHTYVRHSLSADALKFLVDYNGFVPFVGAGVSLERLEYEVDDGTTGDRFNTGVFRGAVSVLLGWDVRPFETNAWTLRTNLRFTPGLDLRTRGDNVAFDHIEINFIQLVVYPERLF